MLTMEKQASVDAPLMRAAVVTGPGAVRIDHLPRPEPGPGQVRVKLEGCGVCASNLTPWAGPEWQSYPLRPGELGMRAGAWWMPWVKASPTCNPASAWRRCPTPAMPNMT